MVPGSVMEEDTLPTHNSDSYVLCILWEWLCGNNGTKHSEPHGSKYPSSRILGPKTLDPLGRKYIVTRK